MKKYFDSASCRSPLPEDCVEMNSCGPFYDVDEVDPRITKLETALRRSVIALDDWLHTYASDHCDEAKVRESWVRISERGTVAYIAQVQQANREALL